MFGGKRVWPIYKEEESLANNLSAILDFKLYILNASMDGIQHLKFNI